MNAEPPAARGDQPAEPAGPSAPAVRAERVRGKGVREAMALRHEVFVGEQGVPLELEADELDTAATTCHVVLRDVAGAVVATGRVLPQPGGVAHLGRIAVAAQLRGTGLGARLMAALAHVAWQQAEREGNLRLELSAQQDAIGFYLRCGYRLTSRGPYLDAGITHRDMLRELTDTPSDVHVVGQGH